MSDTQRVFITVVTGVPRSGTSLMMQMLAAGGIEPLADGERPADADNPRGYFEYAPARRLGEDASWIDAARGRAVKIVHALLASLPEPALPARTYRVVSMHRSAAEVAASQRAMLARRGAPEAEGEGARLAAVQRAQLDEAERQLAARPDTRLLRVEHGAVLRDPAGVAASVDAFLGGGLDRAAMAAAVDPALYRQRGDAPRESA